MALFYRGRGKGSTAPRATLNSIQGVAASFASFGIILQKAECDQFETQPRARDRIFGRRSQPVVV